MILSPAHISIDNGISYTGVFLEQPDFDRIIDIIDNTNSNGLIGDDLTLLVQLKEARKELREKCKQ